MNNMESFINAVKKYKNIMLIIIGSPDPDAIGSAYAIKCILSTLSINSDIIISKKISLSQNKAFVKYLNIPLVFKETLTPNKYDAYIIPDFQNNIVKGISDNIPCAAHIDHHAAVHGTAADFSIIDPKAGSTCSIISLMVKDYLNNFNNKELISICTALMFGIQTDTDKFLHAGEIDMNAVNFLSEYADGEIINKLNGIPLSPKTMKYLQKAGENQQIYKDWHIYEIGYVDIGHRDSIAIIADLLLNRPDSQTVIVYAIIEDKQELFLDVSIRSKLKKLDINSFIKRITPTGGGRNYKGAYQIKLDYFIDCPDKELLLKTVGLTTLEKIKKSKDKLSLPEISTLYKSALESLVSFFKK
ncbi:MAG: DHH family phosphoesterase [Leptospirales bacterium]|nr:DHH family phosphoesterase [Leptospirales bacterium]